MYVFIAHIICIILLENIEVSPNRDLKDSFYPCMHSEYHLAPPMVTGSSHLIIYKVGVLVIPLFDLSCEQRAHMQQI